LDSAPRRMIGAPASRPDSSPGRPSSGIDSARPDCVRFDIPWWLMERLAIPNQTGIRLHSCGDRQELVARAGEQLARALQRGFQRPGRRICVALDAGPLSAEVFAAGWSRRRGPAGVVEVFWHVQSRTAPEEWRARGPAYLLELLETAGEPLPELIPATLPGQPLWRAAASYERTLRGRLGLRRGELPRFDAVVLELPCLDVGSHQPWPRPAWHDSDHLVCMDVNPVDQAPSIRLTGPAVRNTASMIALCEPASAWATEPSVVGLNRLIQELRPIDGPLFLCLQLPPQRRGGEGLSPEPSPPTASCPTATGSLLRGGLRSNRNNLR